MAAQTDIVSVYLSTGEDIQTQTGYLSRCDRLKRLVQS